MAVKVLTGVDVGIDVFLDVGCDFLLVDLRGRESVLGLGVAQCEHYERKVLYC